MCRHCERIIEDVQHKDVVHKFMQALADGVNRKIRSGLTASQELRNLVTPDDIDIELKVNAEIWNRNQIAETISSNRELASRIGRIFGMDPKCDPLK